MVSAELISIGDEILIGDVVNTNANWLALQLTELGVNVAKITTISDDEQQIINALQKANNSVDIAIVTGGLGPTSDDITKKTLSKLFDTKLVRDEQAIRDIENLLGTYNKKTLDINLAQAEVLEGGKTLRNQEGTSPGMLYRHDKTLFIILPGVPYEMKHIFDSQVVSEIKTQFELPSIVHKYIMTTGIPESVLAFRLTDWESQLHDNVLVAYLPEPGIIRIRLSASGVDETVLSATIDKNIEQLKEIVPSAIFGFDNAKLEEIVGQRLLATKQTVATAESCTGGNIGHLITSVAGCSAYYLGSVIAYSNQVKHEIVGVNKAAIDEHGAVSQQVVCQMAEGVRKLCKTDFGVATSGVAGPGGGSPGKPVGTTWIAIATPHGTVSQVFSFGINRQRTIRKASITALNMLRLAIEQ